MSECANCKALQRRIEQRDKLKLHSDRHWIKAAEQALNGDPTSLKLRMAMFDDYPVDAELS